MARTTDKTLAAHFIDEGIDDVNAETVREAYIVCRTAYNHPLPKTMPKFDEDKVRRVKNWIDELKFRGYRPLHFYRS